MFKKSTMRKERYCRREKYVKPSFLLYRLNRCKKKKETDIYSYAQTMKKIWHKKYKGILYFEYGHELLSRFSIFLQMLKNFN